MTLTESLKHKIYKASLGMVHGEMQSHPDLIRVLQQRNNFYSGDEVQPVQKFIKDFRNIITEIGYEPE